LSYLARLAASCGHGNAVPASSPGTRRPSRPDLAGLSHRNVGGPVGRYVWSTIACDRTIGDVGMKRSEPLYCLSGVYLNGEAWPQSK
jgi:hypothetical protein